MEATNWNVCYNLEFDLCIVIVARIIALSFVRRQHTIDRCMFPSCPDDTSHDTRTLVRCEAEPQKIVEQLMPQGRG